MLALETRVWSETVLTEDDGRPVTHGAFLGAIAAGTAVPPVVEPLRALVSSLIKVDTPG